MNIKTPLITDAGSISSDGTRITNPGGAAFVTTQSVVTGAFKIKLPVAVTRSYTMLRMTVKIYTYSTGRSYTLDIGGYNYGDGNWHNVSAVELTDSGFTLQIRFGYDGTSNCIWIGELGSTWDYPQVFVTDVQAGFQNYDARWATGWSITPVTAFDTVTISRIAAKAITNNDVASLSVDHATTANYSSWLGTDGYNIAPQYDGDSIIDLVSDSGLNVRVPLSSNADWASTAGTAVNVDWTGVNNKPTTLQGYGIAGGTMTQNSTSADFLVLVNQHGASQDKSFIRFKHYTDGRESANIRAEVGYPSNGGWNGALVFSTCPVMGAGTASTDSMVLDKDGHLRLLRGNLIVAGTGQSTIAGSLAVTGNITAANIKSLSAFGAKSGAIGAVGSVTAYSRNITIDGVTVTVLVTN